MAVNLLSTPFIPIFSSQFKMNSALPHNYKTRSQFITILPSILTGLPPTGLTKHNSFTSSEIFLMSSSPCLTFYHFGGSPIRVQSFDMFSLTTSTS